MKKLLYALLFVIFLGFIPIMNVKALEEYKSFKEFETQSGETLYVERLDKTQEQNVSRYEYRFRMGDTCVDFSLGLYSTQYSYFYESSEYYFFYGCITDTDLSKKSAPFIVLTPKNLKYTKVYYEQVKDKIERFTALIEYPIGKYVVTRLYDGEYDGPLLKGEYKLVRFNQDLEFDSHEIELGGDYGPEMNVCYDLLEVNVIWDKIYYFDKNFNLTGGYLREETKNGSFTLYAPTKVNETLYYTGSTFTVPGIYELDDLKHEKKTITLEAEIRGVEDLKTYDDYVEFRVSGGVVLVNGKVSSLNGLVGETGEYTLTVMGEGGYQKTIHFTIAPKLLTELTDGGVMHIGETLEFTGYAKINDGEFIKSSYDIKEPGTYKLTLYASETSKESKTIMFTVPEVTITKRDKTWVYIILSVSIVGMSSVVAFVCISIAKKKRNFR